MVCCLLCVGVGVSRCWFVSNVMDWVGWVWVWCFCCWLGSLWCILLCSLRFGSRVVGIMICWC